ncbi:MAG: ClpXP protease specificity-enhancing factor SspB [Alphaproteobacteria bacterium]|nr:ClpXP protease specificity-enhancing factor SspB [Alphaproteobacteria bacterium]
MDRGKTPKDEIGYQALTQAALKSVLRAALRKAATLGALPGDHHFYITFRTRMPGVQMADHLKDRFPDEMTIVIQLQYWDFEVHDERFEVGLKFDRVLQHLRIPFAAVTRFFDPSVNFGLQFDPAEDPGSMETAPESGGKGAATAAPAGEAAGGEATVVSLDAFRRK